AMLTLETSYPPSVNSYYDKWGEGSKVQVRVAKPGMNYRAEVYRIKLEHLNGDCPLKGRLSMEVELWMPDRRKRDIDNPLKCMLDALTYAGVWNDDEQVDCLLVHRKGVEAPGRAKITLREIS
ncbi:MAG: RusA family crossover junction endodeoxyribonuclease, partial [Lysobacterales bacterium]